LTEINAAALRLLELEDELVRRLGGWLGGEIAGVLGMAPEIGFADQLEARRFDLATQQALIDAVQ
jgi:hypothetical protein